MVYEYECLMCGSRQEPMKSTYHMDRNEYCESCQLPMKRKISMPFVNFRHNLTVRERDENTRYRIETGSNRIAVGNEKPNLTPKLKEYPDVGLALQRHYNG